MTETQETQGEALDIVLNGYFDPDGSAFNITVETGGVKVALSFTEEGSGDLAAVLAALPRAVMAVTDAIAGKIEEEKDA